ncbi:hypothetical protein N836_03575 [Leptolyngbya sp. Heron Island J]|uniref:hypothetical protein n=1 Tax=Leptolyngbya sp. Heron Island J TaxID=1385935 RepID=UPI0003B97EB1|nr:hypothetical protein [Leptolyngbya sp. Heron Island J]ESA37327.1 hypothetical protein N836_03575 [Leptolyngbya sp. Heron Island J]
MQSTLYTASFHAVKFALDTIEAGKSTRRWWETDETIAPLLKLVLEIVWLTILLAVDYFRSGSAECHYRLALRTAWRCWNASVTAWEYINTLVDDGLGLYGPSPICDRIFSQSAQLVELELPTIDPTAHLIDGVPADEWFARRIVIH